MRIGWHRNLQLRTALRELGINSDGVSSRDVSYKASIIDDCWALNIIRQYKRKGTASKIIMWSWLTRGLVSPELLAEWHFKGNVQDLNEAMANVRGALLEIVRLHAEHTSSERFNMVDIDDIDRINSFKEAMENPEDTAKNIR